MTTKDIQDLLTAISQTLTAIKDFPVFEDALNNGSYYIMSDLTVGDAIQALNEVVQGIEIANPPNALDQFSDVHLTPDLEGAIGHLSALGTAIIQADKASRPSDDKAAAQEAARQDGHDISGWV